MNFLLHVPLTRGSTRGNWITAQRWAGILETLGHSVNTVDPDEVLKSDFAAYDCLIGLHARRSSAVIHQWKRENPSRTVIVALTGTDLHLDLSAGGIRTAMVMDSLQVADHIVLLEPEGRAKLPREVHHKCCVIFQSSPKARVKSQGNNDEFCVSMLAHLRDVKDPSLIVKALEYLPSESRIRVVHAGEATTQDWCNQASRWNRNCPRYQWLGPVPHDQALTVLANSQLTVLTSQHEGAPGVFSEAAAHGVPVLATAITASLGILGGNHPGLFEVGDASELARLMWQAESEPGFYQQLFTASNSLCDRLSPEQEVLAWGGLVEQFDVAAG